MNVEYNEYSYETIKRLISEGQKAAKEYDSINDFLYATDYTFSEWEYVGLGSEYPDWEIGEIKTYYRIGEPAIDRDGRYANSYNHADDRPEAGVSVATIGWLHSFKSVFFSSDDEAIKRRGVYKIVGFELPNLGGDDEILIRPMDWAERTDINTREELEHAVQKEG